MSNGVRIGLRRFRDLAALLAAVLLGCCLATAGAPSAQAATACPAVDVPSSTKTAMAVFEGTVEGDAVASAKTDGSRGALYAHTVSVQTVYQGRIRTATVTVQTDRTPKQCSLGVLTPGQTYMFFVQGDGNPWVAAGGAGTAPATTDLVASVQSILGQGRPAVRPTPEQAEFTAVNPPAPQTLTRAAAPGVAMVLVGLLGLILIRSRRQPR